MPVTMRPPASSSAPIIAVDVAVDGPVAGSSSTGTAVVGEAVVGAAVVGAAVVGAAVVGAAVVTGTVDVVAGGSMTTLLVAKVVPETP